MAFVELIKNDEPDVLQFGIGLQPARENAFGQHLDAGLRRNPAVKANAVTDGLSRRLAEQMRHARTGGTRRQPARLQYQDGATGEPGFIQQRERNVSGLAGAGRRLQHHGLVRGEGLAQRRQDFVDREFLSDHDSRRQTGRVSFTTEGLELMTRI